jgi:hypothetical protein
MSLPEDDKGFTTLSDSHDPRRAPDPVPGGIVQSVSVSRSGDLNALVPRAEEWVRSAPGDTAEVATLIRAVARRVESEFGLALTVQTVTAVLEGPAKEAELPRRPAQSLTSVKEIVEGTPQSDKSSDYYILGGALRAQKGVALREKPVQVEYEAGESNLPPNLRLALKRIVTDHYDQRGDLVADGLDEIPRSARQILREHSKSL